MTNYVILMLMLTDLVKLLKIKAFIMEKFLDTAFQPLIRFCQKVLMAF
jgi:hypothetical protein